MDLNSFKEFFVENQEEFQKSYPGLKFQRLLEDIDESTNFENLKEQMLLRKPLEYIFNRKYFYKNYFYVDSNVLIPRSETEILVEDAINFIRKENYKSVLDIGTGSGCIPISIASEVDSNITFEASDISVDALEICKKNVEAINIKNEFKFTQSDRLSKIKNKFDLIVSNPPYIKEVLDSHKVHVQVVQYEPHLALFLKDEEYEKWFKELFYQVNDHLNDNGTFIMEGHEDHLSNLKEIGQSIFNCDIILKNDYTGRTRFLIVRK